ELVQVGAEDAEELEALQQRIGPVAHFLQHPAVEAEPGEFPVEIVIRRERGRDRCLHDFTPRARRARGGGRSPLAPLAGRAGSGPRGRATPAPARYRTPSGKGRLCDRRRTSRLAAA